MAARRDPRQVPLRVFVSAESLRWVLRNRAWTPYYLVRFWRFLRLRLRHPGVVTEGFVFLGRDVEVVARRGYGRIVLGRWVHLGDRCSLRAHEGTLRIGDKTVLGREDTINCYLDVNVGPRCIVADWVYIGDFDHRYEDLQVPIKDQGIVKSPVRIGADVWIGVKASVLRGAQVGDGCVLAAHTVVKGDVPAGSIVAGLPGRVVRDRGESWAAAAERRAVPEADARANARVAREVRPD
jgi:acetyltransferase-like isoleucine patch superfamily enzyme